MKLFYKDAIGFLCLILITITGGLVLFDSQLKVGLISEYHDKMSEPTINVLQETLMSYEKMQKITNNIILFNQGYEEYEYEFERLHYLTSRYDQLSNSVNSNQELMASHEMRIMMANHSNIMHAVVERTDEINQQIFVSLKEDNFNDIQIDNLFVELNNQDKAITFTIQTAITMELEGKTSQQQRIDRYVIDSTFTIFGMIIFMICIIVMIMTFSRNPMLTNIKNMKNATSKISEGNFDARVSVVGNKDELFDLADDINLMAKKLMEQQQKLIRTERISAIGELSANIAHDMRNPLSIIKVSLENLKSMYGVDDTKQMQFDKVERSIDRMVHQMDNVLDFVKKQPLTLVKTKMSEVISESLDSLTIPSEIKLIPPENDIELFCDKIQLAVALNNLILNGIQAIVGSGTIEISVEENNEWIVIKVKDSGKAIPKEELDTIFDPLFTTKQHGTGLGLASVKSIIDAHGGTVSVTSPPVIFTIRLPKTSD